MPITMHQRNVTANTIASYRDTFRLLFMFAQVRLRKSPTLADLDATFIGAFLTDLEVKRGASAKMRNLRLTANRIHLSMSIKIYAATAE
ncbi:hypothetical protein XI03_02745 [Bradyrhizobium sp. CCBAU 65884]|uniref:hypothetical protein n=1 Tax=Bradyrhizobium sp. CCBAU 65884 TaxID=722477 RepID=UPI002306483E|nr:hypothetical protein [Bradyrhizobium sp. CCBAU 65884]MDA9473448.1 hypothetical protein [Bradyrhizobium sp. CCBAU 65884]